MNKKIIIIFIIIILPFLGFIIFLLLQNNNNNETLNSYTLSITEKNKSIIESFVTIGNNTTEIDPKTIGSYAITSYNSTYEIFWVLCLDGYKMTNATSNTQNKVNFNSEIGASTDVTPDKSNNVIVSCQK